MQRTAAAVILAMIPATASANAGIGYLLVNVPQAVLGLLPAMVLEMLVLARMLPAAMSQARSLSWRANLRSTLWGIAVAIATDRP